MAVPGLTRLRALRNGSITRHYSMQRPGGMDLARLPSRVYFLHAPMRSKLTEKTGGGKQKCCCMQRQLVKLQVVGNAKECLSRCKRGSDVSTRAFEGWQVRDTRYGVISVRSMSYSVHLSGVLGTGSGRQAGAKVRSRQPIESIQVPGAVGGWLKGVPSPLFN